MLADILHCYGLVDSGRDHNMIFFFFSPIYIYIGASVKLPH